MPTIITVVSVATSILSETNAAAFWQQVQDEYEEVRVRRARNQTRQTSVSIEAARANKTKLDLSVVAPRPQWEGVRTFLDYPLADLVERIDWTPFFQTWELAGHYPEILTDEVVGETIDLERRSGWLNTALGALNERELKIIRERRLHEEGATLESLGERLGISKERVRQIENRALEKLRTALVRENPELASM